VYYYHSIIYENVISSLVVEANPAKSNIFFDFEFDGRSYSWISILWVQWRELTKYYVYSQTAPCYKFKNSWP
jgi:hypothetical protein